MYCLILSNGIGSRDIAVRRTGQSALTNRVESNPVVYRVVSWSGPVTPLRSIASAAGQ